MHKTITNKSFLIMMQLVLSYPQMHSQHNATHFRHFGFLCLLCL